MTDERTPLTSNPNEGPSSLFLLKDGGIRDGQVKRFQCLICSSIIGAFVIAVVIAIAYIIVGDQGILPANNTMDDNSTIIIPDMLTLLSFPIDDEQPSSWELPISEEDQQEALELGERALGDKDLLEEIIGSPAVNTPSFRHQRAVSTSAAARSASKRGYVEDHATRAIAKKNNVKKRSKRWNIGHGPKITLHKPKEVSYCNFNAKYRTSNGTCNNKKNPSTYGVALIPFRRQLNPDYADGISAPRAAIAGEELPSARQISIEIHRPSYSSDPHFSVMLAVWGQFMDHDITATALNQKNNGEPIECCIPNAPLHPECFPVPLGPGDPYYHEYNLTCMNFVRSTPAPTGRFGPREQLNQATAFIDGSVVYGNDDAKHKALRTMSGGKLKMYKTPDNRDLLPVNTDPNDGCNEESMNAAGKYCFDSGDARANENLHLTSMHLIWARHHNYLVEELAKVNPQWDDETLFQEARKILGAQMQHITYNEFIPIILGNETSEKIGILSDPESTKDTYNSTVDPSIANIFAAAAFRFAHTLLPGLMRATKDPNSSYSGIELHKMLFNPYSLYGASGLDDALNGAMSTPLARSDQYFTSELTQKLFQHDHEEDDSSILVDRPCGLDLVSLNIQRGRDHGLASYPEWRRHCRLSPVDTWEQVQQVVDADSYKRMRDIYKLPENIDVYSGGLSEPPVKGGILGPMITCLLGDQFVRLKTGDSFWYERKVGPQRFTSGQLNQIYGTSLSSVICRNSDAVKESPMYVMRKTDKNTNPEIPCTQLDTFNIEPWREHKSVLPHVGFATDTSKVLVVH